MARMSFDEVAPGLSVPVYSGGMVDAKILTMGMTRKDSNQSCEVLRRLDDEIFNKSNLLSMRLPGAGNKKTIVVHFKHAIELVMVLPGRMAKETRVKFVDIITRYFAGDASLVSEAQANAQSSHPIAEMARASLDSGAGSKQGGEELEGTEELVKRSREMAEFAGTAHLEMISAVECARELVEHKKALLVVEERGLELKERSVVVDEKARAKQLEDEAKARAKQLEDEDTRRAKELKHIRDVALAKAEAEMIVAKGIAKANGAAQAPDPYPNVATFLPDDHTTVKKTYTDTYPKYKPRLKRDERSFLNEAQTRARQVYQTEQGRPPLKVREDRQIVDMFPTSWNGVVESLAGIHREREGFGQQSIINFTVNHHHPPA